MLSYDCEPAPNPRRVRLYLAEKGIDIPCRQIDLFKDEQLGIPAANVNTQRWFDAIAARAPVRAHPLRL